jgi:hypothetical protein
VNLGVQVRFGARVTEYDPYRGEIGVQNWEYVRGDLIIAADGLLYTVFGLERYEDLTFGRSELGCEGYS